MFASNVDRWLWWDWIGRNTDLISSSLREHVVLTALAVGIRLLIALPLGVPARRRRRVYPPPPALAGVLLMLLSVAPLAFLMSSTGLPRTTSPLPLPHNPL